MNEMVYLSEPFGTNGIETGILDFYVFAPKFHLLVRSSSRMEFSHSFWHYFAGENTTPVLT